MLEGKSEKLEVPRDVELTTQKKIEVSKSKTKIMKKEPREMEIEKMKRMRVE